MCGNDRSDLKLEAPDRFDLKGGNRYRIVVCVNCNFVFLNPRPTADWIAEVYKSASYQPFSSAQSQSSFLDRVYSLARVVNVRVKRRKIEKSKSKGRILDVGCGTGEFLNEMQRHGWQTAGLETNEKAAEYAQSNFEFPISTRELTTADFGKASFDVITFWHVLEHVFDPIQTLMAAKRILKDDGIILVACPNIGSSDASFYGNRWVALDAPRHLCHFVPTTMAAACAKTGLELFRLQPMGLDAVYNCLMSEQSVIKNGKVPVSQLLWLRALVMAGVSLTVSKFDRKRGSAILYFLKKRAS